MIVDFLDEILDGEQRFRIRDNDGNIVLDNISIEMITAIIQEGTPLNKALFESIHDSIKNVGTYQETQLSSDDVVSIAGANSWETALKAEELEFNLSDKRFFLIAVKTIDISVSYGLAKLLFLFDAKKGNIYPISMTWEAQFAGEDFDNINPNVYIISKSTATSTSNAHGVGIAFTKYDAENKILKCQTCWYNSSTLSVPNDVAYSISVDVCELLANTEVNV